MTTEQSIWASAKSFFLRSPLSISTEALDKPRKSSPVSFEQQQQKTVKRVTPVATTSDAYFINTYGSLNLP